MNIIETQTRRWLNDVVIGLHLCPFADKPSRNQQVRFYISQASSETVLLTELQSELRYLDKTPANTVETTVMIVPDMLQDFLDFNQFLGLVDKWLAQESWQGVYQIASFHPHYCFADTAPSDNSNLTNCSPYPILHIIREASVEKALQHYPTAALISEKNIATVNTLSHTEKQHLFPYLFMPN